MSDDGRNLGDPFHFKGRVYQRQSDGQVAVLRRPLSKEETDRLALYEATLRKIQDAIAGYLHPEQRLTKDQFIDAVLAAADDRELVKAMRNSK